MKVCKKYRRSGYSRENTDLVRANPDEEPKLSIIRRSQKDELSEPTCEHGIKVIVSNYWKKSLIGMLFQENVRLIRGIGKTEPPLCQNVIEYLNKRVDICRARGGH